MERGTPYTTAVDQVAKRNKASGEAPTSRTTIFNYTESLSPRKKKPRK